MAVERKMVIDSNLVKSMEGLVDNFPRPKALMKIEEGASPEIYYKNNVIYHNNLETYKAIDEKVQEALHTELEYFSTKDIDIPYDSSVMPVTILTVEMDVHFDELVKKAIELEGKYLDEMMKGIGE